jgi:hypothetical protein
MSGSDAQIVVYGSASSGEFATPSQKNAVGAQSIVPYGTFEEEGDYNRQSEQYGQYGQLHTSCALCHNHCQQREREREERQLRTFQPSWCALSLQTNLAGELLHRSHDGVHGTYIPTVDPPEEG